MSSSACTNGTALTISVAAGKGGTGKTLLATSLAVALGRQQGRAVQILDCDVEEPNADLLLHPEFTGEEPVTISVPDVDMQRCTRCGMCGRLCQTSAIAMIRDTVVTFPELCSGCGTCAYGCPEEAITEVPRRVGMLQRGTTQDGIHFSAGRLDVGQQRAGAVTRAVKGEIRSDWLTIIDAPPGTACPMQETIEGTDFCVLVTEPTPFGLSDLGLAVETCRSLDVPCGVVLNRDGVGDAKVEGYCSTEGLDLLLRIPHDRAIAEAYSRGETLVHAFPEWTGPLLDTFARIDELTQPKEMTNDATR